MMCYGIIWTAEDKIIVPNLDFTFGQSGRDLIGNK